MCEEAWASICRLIYTCLDYQSISSIDSSLVSLLEENYHGTRNGLSTVREYKQGLYNSNTSDMYPRRFSAIGNDKADTPNGQECHVLLGTNDTHTTLLYQILLSSARTGAAVEGKACHAHIIRIGLQSDTIMSNMHINMYSKCRFLSCGRKLFDEMPERSLVSWYDWFTCPEWGGTGSSYSFLRYAKRRTPI